MSPSRRQARSQETAYPPLAGLVERLEPSWTADHRTAAATVAERLITEIPSRGVPVISLSGAPGSGKSSLSRLIKHGVHGLGRHCTVISLDDYYLGRVERQRLAELQPLFANRGVPGTHNWDQLLADLDALHRGDVDNLLLPRFDKSTDDIAPRDQFQPVAQAPDVIILEGWLIGCDAQDEMALETPINDWEARHDPEGQWRRMVNKHLERYQRDLRGRLDLRWFLAAPDWESVVDWRWQQEGDLEQSQDRSRFLHSRQAVREFLGPFERIVRHMLAHCVDRADRVIRIDRRHLMSVDAA